MPFSGTSLKVVRHEPPFPHHPAYPPSLTIPPLFRTSEWHPSRGDRWQVTMKQLELSCRSKWNSFKRKETSAATKSREEEKFRTGKGIHVVFAPEAGSRVIRFSFEVFTPREGPQVWEREKGVLLASKISLHGYHTDRRFEFPNTVYPMESTHAFSLANSLP